MKPIRVLTLTAAIAGIALSAAPASAAHIPGFGFAASPFTFDGTGTAGVPGITASYIDFSYEAEVDQNGCGGGTCAFQETGLGFFGTFRNSLGGPPVGGSGLGTSYNLYAVFSGTGATTLAAGPSIEGVFNAFSVEVFIDPGMNTDASTFTEGGANESKFATGVTGDDISILTGTLGTGGFHVFSGLAGGDFDVEFNVTSFNSNYWGGLAFAGGNPTGDINGVNTLVSGVAAPNTAFVDGRIIGSGNTSFHPVPEPASLALLGLAFAGLGVARRMKK